MKIPSLLILLLLSSSHVVSKELVYEESIVQKNYRQTLNKALAPVKNYAELKALSQVTSPLDLLSPEAKRRFIDSVIFSGSEVGGFDYKDLEAELTPSEIYKILALLGVQHIVPMMTGARVESDTDLILMSAPSVQNTSFKLMADHIGYACASRATCNERQGSICMSGC